MMTLKPTTRSPGRNVRSLIMNMLIYLAMMVAYRKTEDKQGIVFKSYISLRKSICF